MKVAEKTCDYKSLSRLDLSEKIHLFLEYAILAPSNFNSQPWTFEIKGTSLNIHTDLRYWLKSFDGSQKELFMSIGCCLENLLIAAKFFGVQASVKYLPVTKKSDLCVIVDFKKSRGHLSKTDVELFHSIEKRFTLRTPFSNTTVPSHLLYEIKSCFIEERYRIFFIEDFELKHEITDLAFRADVNQFRDMDFRHEFVKIVDQGIIGHQFLVEKFSNFIDHFFPSESKNNLGYVGPVFGVVSSENNEKIDWIKLGQILERIYLKTTSLGLAIRPIFRVIEEERSYKQFAKLVANMGMIPQIPFSIGYAKSQTSSSTRRPLNSFFKSTK